MAGHGAEYIDVATVASSVQVGYVHLTIIYAICYHNLSRISWQGADLKTFRLGSYHTPFLSSSELILVYVIDFEQ